LIGLIKRVTRTYRYYLTRLGRAAIAAACPLTQFQIIAAMAIAKRQILLQYRQLVSKEKRLKGRSFLTITVEYSLQGDFP
jgi:hypothetical protein